MTTIIMITEYLYFVLIFTIIIKLLDLSHFQALCIMILLSSFNSSNNVHKTLSFTYEATDISLQELTHLDINQENNCSTESLINADTSGNYRKMEKRINAIHDVVVSLSKELKLSPCIILSMISQESSFNAKASSNVGAKGLMQVMPNTRKSVIQSLGSKYNLFITSNLSSGLTVKELDSILVGSTYFKSLVNKFKGNQNIAVIAYNEGPTKIQRMINKNISFGQNHNHLNKVKANLTLLASN